MQSKDKPHQSTVYIDTFKHSPCQNSQTILLHVNVENLKQKYLGLPEKMKTEVEI